MSLTIVCMCACYKLSTRTVTHVSVHFYGFLQVFPIQSVVIAKVFCKYVLQAELSATPKLKVERYSLLLLLCRDAILQAPLKQMIYKCKVRFVLQL